MKTTDISTVKPWLNFLLFTVLVLDSIWMHAYEVDQLSGIAEKPTIKDSADIINAELNRLVDLAVSDANSTNGRFYNKTPCDSEKKADWDAARLNLFNNLKDRLYSGLNPVGHLEDFAESSKAVDKRKVAVDQSIYADVPVTETIIKTVGLHSVIRIGTTEIGTDKLGHFLTQGYSEYLDLKYVETKDVRKIMSQRSSISSERGGFGGATTGVVSYADHAANIHGFNFWHRLCGLTSKDRSDADRAHFKERRCYPDSYLMCEKGNWVRNPKNKIDLRDFIDASWDESINCNSYTFPEETYEKVFSQMSRRAFQWQGNPKQPCPRDPMKCQELAAKKNMEINPICYKMGAKMLKGEKIDPNVKFDYSFQLNSLKKPKTAADLASEKAARDKKFMDSVNKKHEQRR